VRCNHAVAGVSSQCRRDERAYVCRVMVPSAALPDSALLANKS
jgi:hypothetical protein